MSEPTRKRVALAGVVAGLLATLAVTPVITAPRAEASPPVPTPQSQEEATVTRADLEREIARLDEALVELRARQSRRADELEERYEAVMARLEEAMAVLQERSDASTEAQRRRLEESMAEAARQLQVTTEERARRMKETLAEASRHARREREQQARRVQEELARLEAQAAEVRARSARQAEEVRLRSRQAAERAREMAARAAEQARRGVVYSASGSIGSYAFVGCEDLAEEVLEDAEELDLTEQQTREIRDRWRSFRRDRIDRRADLEIADMDLEDLRRAEPMDLNAVEAKLREIADLQVQSSIASLRLRQQVLDLLTPEQRDRLDEEDDRREVAVIAVGSSRLARFGC